jgi:hypothetical protein
MSLGVKDSILVAGLIAAVPPAAADMLPVEVEDYKKATAALAQSVVRFSAESGAPTLVPVEVDWSFLSSAPVKAMDRDARKTLPTRILRAIDNGLFWPGDGLSSMLMAAPTAAKIFHSMVHSIRVEIATDNNIVADKVGAAHYSLTLDQAAKRINIRLKLSAVANSDAWGPKFQAVTGLRAVDEATARDQLKPFDEAVEKYISQTQHNITFELDFQAIFDVAGLQNKDRAGKKDVFTKLLRDVQRGLYGVGGLDMVAFCKANTATFTSAVQHVVVKLASVVVPKVGQDGLSIDYDVNTRRLMVAVKPENSGKLDGWKVKLDALATAFSGAPAGAFTVQRIPVWPVLAQPSPDVIAAVAARAATPAVVVPAAAPAPVMPVAVPHPVVAATPTPTAAPVPANAGASAINTLPATPTPQPIAAPAKVASPTPASPAKVAPVSAPAAPAKVASPAPAKMSPGPAAAAGSTGIDTSILSLPTLPPASASPAVEIPPGDDADVQAVNEKIAALATRMSSESQAPGFFLVEVDWSFLHDGPVKSKSAADRKALIAKIPKGMFFPTCFSIDRRSQSLLWRILTYSSFDL